MKIKLSIIKKVSPGKLKSNVKNNLFFKAETGAYFNKLTADIEKRGITTPLIAKNDGTLIAGHNRLLIAKTLKIKTVPVQYIENKLSEKEEIEFIIKDNLLRRHLSPAERDQLYRKVVADFDDKVMIKNAKGVSVDVKEIAEKTGLNPKTINYDLIRNRKENLKKIKQNSPIDVSNEKAIEQYKKAVSKMLNTAIVEKEKTINEFIEITRMAMDRLSGIK